MLCFVPAGKDEEVGHGATEERKSIGGSGSWKGVTEDDDEVTAILMMR